MKMLNSYRLKSFFGLVRKEVRHILRDTRTLAVLLLIPVVQVILFGFAIQTDIEDVRLIIVDPAPDARTLDVRDRFAASTYYTIVEVERSTDALATAFERGRVDQAVVFSPGFGRDLRSADGADVQVITGTADPTTGRSVESYARAVLQRYAQEQGVTGGNAARLVADTRFRYNETLESQNLFVPGLLAFVLTIVSALMTAITLSREKETGTLEVLLVSPLRPVDIILGKVMPYLGLAFLNVLTTLGVAWLVFNIPFRGSLFLLLNQCLLFVLVCLALGILVATRTPDQRSALIAVILGTLLPTAIFSGMIFPITSMPDWLQPITHAIPAKWFIRIARSIMLKETGIEAIWQETVILGGMAVTLLSVSIASFSERLQ